MLAGLSVLIALLGIGAGWYMFQKRPLLQMPRLLENKYYVDEIYDAALIRPIEAGSREGLWKLFDVGAIDGLLHAIGETVTEMGRLARYLQGGFVRGYAAIILFGALILIGLFAYSGLSVDKPVATDYTDYVNDFDSLASRRRACARRLQLCVEQA